MKLSTVLKIVFPLVIVAAGVFYFVEFGKGGEVKDEGKVGEKTEEVTNLEEVVENGVVDERSQDKVSRPIEEQVEIAKVKVTEDSKVEDYHVDRPVSDEELIKRYYRNLQDQKLENAYALKYDTEKVSFDKFKGWYGNVEIAEVSDFADKGNSKYQFAVYLKEKNGVEEKYLVNMEVIDGLLKTTSSQKTWDNYSPEAFTKKVNGKTNLYVRLGNTEKLVKEFDDINSDDLKKLVLKEYKVVGDKYVTYNAIAWESVVIGVFDINVGKEVYTFGGGTEDYGFSKDLKYFYQCGGTGMHGGEMKIYSVPSFVINKDLYPTGQNGMMHTCHGYNSINNSYIYSVTFDGWTTENIRTYYFDTGVVQ